MEFETMLTAMVEDVTEDYRIEPHELRALLAPALLEDAKLMKALGKAKDMPALARTRAFKDARKKARNTVYYALRQYKRTDLGPLAEALAAAEEGEVDRVAHEILEAHSSTRERLPSRARFEAGLLDALGGARSVVDVGGGVCGMMFPFARAPDLDRYVALDRDRQVTEALSAYAARRAPRLVAARWDIAEGWAGVPHAPYDAALLLKVVPVVARQAPALLPLLAATPARRLLVSGSRVALTKRASIEDRERNLLERWMTDHGLVPTGETIELDEEFVIVAERRSLR